MDFLGLFGEKVVDVFYVLDGEGRKITEPARLDRGRKNLTQVTQAPKIAA